MYRGFNLAVDERIVDFSTRASEGRATLQQRWPLVIPSLDSLVASDDIDGDAIMQDWFRQVEADVFISHSHADEPLALGLAAMMENDLGLRVFVDSMVWSNCDKLLRKFDELFCENPGKKNSYSYDSRNYSTSHMHMMLASSIAQIIDRTECVIFLNTPSSIQISDARHNAGERVASPWIYHELTLTRLIRRNKPKRLLKVALEHHQASVESRAMPKITYEAHLGHLAPLNDVDMIAWSILGDDGLQGPAALDHLYMLHDDPTMSSD